jgi:hypothetical protein
MKIPAPAQAEQTRQDRPAQASLRQTETTAANAQLRLQKIANDSPHARQLKAYGSMAQGSARARRFKADSTLQTKARPVQLAAPTPVDAAATAFNDLYTDADTGVQFRKLGGNRYLLNGRIINWADPNYTDHLNQVINLAERDQIDEQDAEVLDVTQGEAGYLPNAQGPLTSIRSTGASPCVIITIHDTASRQTMMAHIHRLNRVESVLEAAAAGNFNENSDTINVTLTTLEFNQGTQEEIQEERARQEEIIALVKANVGEYLFFVDGDDVVVDRGHQNAQVATADGTITHPLDAAVDGSRGQLGMERAQHHEQAWNGRQATDNSQAISVRTANIMPADTGIFQQKARHPIQRKVSIQEVEQTAKELPDLDQAWTTRLSDPIPRDFVSKGEFDAYRAGNTDYIGTMQKDIKGSGTKWVRFDPGKKYVMGEEHTGVVLSDFTNAVRSMNFQHERFSKLDLIKQQGYKRLAKQTEVINDERYKLYNVDMKNARDINQYALESPMPKIAYCLDLIDIGIKPEQHGGNGSDYSVVGRMMTYLDLSFTIVEDLMARLDELGDPSLVKTTCLKTTLKDIKSGLIDYPLVKKTAKKDLTGAVDPAEMANLKMYCKMFVFDTLLQANVYAEHTPDPSSKLVGSKQKNMGDLTNPVLPGEEESHSLMLSHLRDEEMMNHIRKDVRYVGMGNAHAGRLKERLQRDGFTVIHVPTYGWKPINKF